MIDDAEMIVLRFDADSLSMSEVSATAVPHEEQDIALLQFHPSLGPQVGSSTELGRLSEANAIVRVTALGFPLWKSRRRVTSGQAAPYRDSYHLIGQVAVLSNRRSGTLEVQLDAPGPLDAPIDGSSSWAGMSGAGLFAQNYLIGIVTEHHMAEGSGRVVAARLDRALSDPAALSGPWAQLGASANWPDVLAPLAPLVRRAYLEQVRELLPSGGLQERTLELARITDFCAGDRPYLRLQGRAWAGKTALLSRFVSTPPAGVEVVSYFVRGGLLAEANADTCTDVLLEQLAELQGEELPTLETPQRRDAHRRLLLREASERLSKEGRVLLLVLDGIDEEGLSTSMTGLVSIAALLPKITPSGLRILVATRTGYSLPADVPADHPLREAPIYEVAASPAAVVVREAAESALATLLQGEQGALAVTAVLTACGGGLAVGDLTHLLGLLPFQVQGVLNSAASKRVFVRGQTGLSRTTEAYFFAHDMLRTAASAALGEQLLQTWRLRLRDWARAWREAGWPAGTPAYLFADYPHMLARSGERDELLRLALDKRRHDAMLEYSGGQTRALREVALAEGLATPDSLADLSSALMLAKERHRLAGETHSTLNLITVWAYLDDVGRATRLALALTNRKEVNRALVAVAVALVRCGQAGPAEAVIELLDDLAHQAVARLKLARAAADTGDLVVAQKLMVGAPRGSGRDGALAALARQHANSGKLQLAEGLISEIETTRARARAVSSVVAALIRTSQWSEGLRRAEAEVQLEVRELALLAALRVAASVGRVDFAAECFSRLTSSKMLEAGQGAMAVAIAQTGEVAQALDMARRIRNDGKRVDALVEIACAPNQCVTLQGLDGLAVAAGSHGSIFRSRVAVRLFAEGRRADAAVLAARVGRRDGGATSTGIALELARQADYSGAKRRASVAASPAAVASTLTQCARIAQLGGHPIEAVALAEDATTLYGTGKDRDRASVACQAIVSALTIIQATALAERLFLHIADPVQRAVAAQELGPALVLDGRVEDAFAHLAQFGSDGRSFKARAKAACALAQVGDAVRAERELDQLDWPGAVAASASLAEILFAQAETEHAHVILQAATERLQSLRGRTRDAVAVSLVRAWTTLGARDRALEVAEGIRRPDARSEAYCAYALKVVDQGELRTARLCLPQLHQGHADQLLISLAASMARRGEIAQAQRLVEEVRRPAMALLGSISVAVAVSAVDSRLAEGLLRSASTRATALGDDQETVLVLADGASLTASSDLASSGKHLLVQAFARGHWASLLKPLARLEPQTLLTLAGETLALLDEPSGL